MKGFSGERKAPPRALNTITEPNGREVSEMKPMAAALSLLAGLALSVGSAAHEGHSHRVMGFVKAVDAVHIEIETKEGKRISVLVNEETKYRRGKAAATAADVKVGERVVLTLVGKEGKKIAQEVLLAPSEGEHPSPKHAPGKP